MSRRPWRRSRRRQYSTWLLAPTDVVHKIAIVVELIRDVRTLEIVSDVGGGGGGGGGGAGVVNVKSPDALIIDCAFRDFTRK